MVTWQKWRGRAGGGVVWVVGSGATAGLVDRRLFYGQIVVSVNHAAYEAGIRHGFVVSNHHGVAQELAEAMPNVVAVAPEVEQVPEEHRWHGRLTAPNVVTVPTADQRYDRWDAERDWPEPDTVLPMGPSSAQLALGWAELLGPSVIMLVGLDCGRLDGAKNLPGHTDYPDEHFHPQLWQRSLEGSARVLRSRGIGVHSVNPFVTLHLEGHTFGL